MAEGEDVREEQRKLDALLYGMYINWETVQRAGQHHVDSQSPPEFFDQEGAAILAVRWCMVVSDLNMPRLASGWARRIVGSNAARNCTGADRESVWKNAMQEEAERQIHLLRDIIGYPTRPSRKRLLKLLNNVRLDPQVQRLAQVIYRERDFAALPVLGDALEDAGCSVEEVLAHCRSGGKHVLGCWALDMILGKE
jgi:hypothetical protein